jgi:hypothetical protein
LAARAAEIPAGPAPTISRFQEIWCPYLKQKIIFNSKGKEHLKFKEKHKARLVYDQYIRMKLLKFAPIIVQDSKTLQGINETKTFELNRSNHRNEYNLVDTTYYEFIAVIDKKVRIKIIVKQIEDKQPYFWSIIPFWKQIEPINKRKMYEGNLELD